jgi:hypothetical protein|nr:MAG TPA: hypothetical protein [Caudoviricetes sp.]
MCNIENEKTTVNEDFDEWFLDCIGAISDRMYSKGREYAHDNDRLSQIRAQAKLNGMLPQNVIKCLMSKHATVLLDCNHLVMKKELEERGMDIICYIILWLWLNEDN